MSFSSTGNHRRMLLALCAAALALIGSGPAQAQQSFPERPVRLLVGYSAGGGVDTMARLIALRLSTQLGQQVLVENRAGASGTIAADAVARAAPDGYTLLFGDSALVIAKHLQAKLPFDPLTAFAPVAGLFRIPLLIVAGADFPATSPAELVAALKAKPDYYAYASSGVGTVQHLGFEMLKAQTGTAALHVPYRGAAQIVPDVMGGQVPLGVVSATAGLAQARAGKLRALAMMSDDKLPGAEQVVALSSAVAGFDVAPRLFVLAPAGTPQPVLDRLGQALKATMDVPDMADAAAQQGGVPAFEPAAKLAASLTEESKRWEQVIRKQNISAQ